MPDVRWRVKVDVPAESVKQAGAAVKDLDEKLKDTHGSSKKLTDEVQKLQAKLRELKAPQEIHRLKKEIEETEKHHHKMGGAMKSVIKLLGLEAAGFHSVGIAAHEARESTHEFLEFIGAEVALELLKELGEKLYEIGEEAVHAAAKAQRMNRVINIAAGGPEAGENTRGWLEKFSKTSEFSEAANESAYLRLKRAGVDQTHTGLFMKAAADVAAISENKDEAYQEAISAFERIQLTGKVDARTLRPMGIGVEDFKKLPRFHGMSSKAVREALTKETNVNQGELFKLIMSRAQESKIGTRSADNVDLLSTKMEKLSELPERFYKKLADTKATGELGSALDGVLKKFDPDTPEGAKTVKALEDVITKVAKTIKEIDFDKIAKSITNDVIPAVQELVALINPAVKAIEKMAAITSKTLSGFHVAGKAISDPLGAASDLVRGKGVQQSAYDKLGSAGRLPSQNDKPSTLKDLTGVSLVNKYLGGNYLRDTVLNPEWWNTKSGAAESGAETVGKATGAGLSSGLMSSTADVSAASESMSSAAPEAARSTLDVHSPSRVFEDIGEQTAAGMAKGLAGGAQDVAVATDRMISVPAAPGGGGKAPISVQIHVGGISLAHGGKAEGEAAADAFEKRIRGIIVDVIEQATQGGGV